MITLFMSNVSISLSALAPQTTWPRDVRGVITGLFIESEYEDFLLSQWNFDVDIEKVE